VRRCELDDLAYFWQAFDRFVDGKQALGGAWIKGVMQTTAAIFASACSTFRRSDSLEICSWIASKVNQAANNSPAAPIRPPANPSCEVIAQSRHLGHSAGAFPALFEQLD
jgi:hypothetical protein